MGTKGIIAALLLVSWTMALRAEGIHSSVAVYYPNVPWYLRYELDGVLEEYNNHKPGVSTYTMARSETSGILVSTQLNPAKGAKTALDCREAEHKHIRSHKAFANAKLQLSETAGVDIEVLVPLGEGPAVSRHLHRFWLRDGVCAKMHASKTPFAESDGAGFEKVMNSVRFEPARPTFERAFLIHGRGTLLVTVPAAWGFRTSKPGKITPREIQFMPPGDDYRLMLTLFPDAHSVLKGEPTANGFVEKAREAARPKALEPDPQVLRMKGSSGEGLYFLVTDKDLVGKPAKREDWKYLRQGALLVGESLLFFSMFSNAKESPVVDGALRAVSEARMVSPRR